MGTAVDCDIIAIYSNARNKRVGEEGAEFCDSGVAMGGTGLQGGIFYSQLSFIIRPPSMFPGPPTSHAPASGLRRCPQQRGWHSALLADWALTA